MNVCARFATMFGGALRPRISAGNGLVPRLAATYPAQRGSQFVAGFMTEEAPAPAAATLAAAGPLQQGELRAQGDFTVYKSKSAMAVKLIPPTWNVAGRTRVVERQGIMLLEFARANEAAGGYGQQQQGPAGSINRTYNWGSKVVFGLNANELGTILAGDFKEAAQGGAPTLAFFHDPAKLGKTGEAVKKLNINVARDGNLYFNLSAGEARVDVQVTKGEFEVLKSLARFAIPHLLGFDAVLHVTP